MSSHVPSVPDRTVPRRGRHRMIYDRDTVYAILDEALTCAVGFVIDGAPRVLPMLHVRLADTLYLHGSTGGTLALTARDGGVAICVSATLLDGLVFARAQSHSSLNYRSVIAHGAARPVVSEAERERVLAALVDRMAPGRAADSRPPNPAELAATSILALPLLEAAAKVRQGGPIDDPADLALPHWAGVVPIQQVRGRAVPADGIEVPIPSYLNDRKV